MGIITIEQNDSLFWLGRYTERVYTTVRLYANRYDIMIDEIAESYRKFCNEMNIPDVYGSKEKFISNYPFDTSNPDSIISNLTRAYDNAIILRDEIGSDGLSYIQLAVYDIQKAQKSNAPLLEIQKLIDHILAFWGYMDDSIESKRTRDAIKVGKRLERIDMYARLRVPRVQLSKEISKLYYRLPVSGLSYDKYKLEQIKMLAESENIDYYSIVENIESLVEI